MLGFPLGFCLGWLHEGYVVYLLNKKQNKNIRSDINMKEHESRRSEYDKEVNRIKMIDEIWS